MTQTLLSAGNPHGRDYNHPFPLPNGYRDCLNHSDASECLVAQDERLARLRSAQTFTILPHARFCVRTGNDEVGKEHSTIVLMSVRIPYNVSKRKRTLDFEKPVSIPVVRYE